MYGRLDWRSVISERMWYEGNTGVEANVAGSWNDWLRVISVNVSVVSWASWCSD